MRLPENLCRPTIAGAACFEIRSASSFTVNGIAIYYTNRTLPEVMRKF
ncbi:hypothetical protein [Chryseobacterium sp. Marseille-Q8038]